MAFIVEDGTGLEDANAYIEVVFADSYFADRGEAGWTGTDEVKEQAIIRATDYVEQRWGDLFRGLREFPDVPQALSFPRAFLYDRDGRAVVGVPVKLQKACAEYAIRALTGTLFPDPTAEDSATVIREKVGPIETETNYAVGGQEELPEYPSTDRLLQEYVFSPGVFRN